MALLRILSASASAAPPRKENLEEKIVLGKEVLGVLDVLDPGLTVQRGGHLGSVKKLHLSLFGKGKVTSAYRIACFAALI